MIRSKHLLTLLIAGTILTACSTKPQEVNLSQRLPLQAPAPIQTKPVQWKIVKDADQTYFALSPEDFDKLVDNDADKLRWIKEAVLQLQYYVGKSTDDKPK